MAKAFHRQPYCRTVHEFGLYDSLPGQAYKVDLLTKVSEMLIIITINIIVNINIRNYLFDFGKFLGACRNLAVCCKVKALRINYYLALGHAPDRALIVNCNAEAYAQ